MILICSDGVYGNGKWGHLEDALRNDASSVNIDTIKAVAGKNAHDNYSAVLIRIE